MGFNLFSTGLLPTGNSAHYWFSNGRKPRKVRTYTAIPFTDPDQHGDVTFEVLPPADEMISVEDVYHLLFGTQHPQPEWRNLQVNVTVVNRNQQTFCLYELYEWES